MDDARYSNRHRGSAATSPPFEGREEAGPEVLISIRPQHAGNIVGGIKTVEFRRRFPSEARVLGATIWLYATAPVQQVIGAATVAAVDCMSPQDLWDLYRTEGAVERRVFDEYFSGAIQGYAIRLTGITRLVTAVDAAKLKALEFATPQSYRFVTDRVVHVLRGCLSETPA